MVARKKGLGKGLDALLGVNSMDPIARPDSTLSSVPVDLIQRSNYQPRKEFSQEALQGLVNSIKAQRIMQPVVVRPVGDGKYEIIAGERRWRAAQLAGLHEVPVVVRNADDLEAMTLALIENIQREDLKPLEQARGLHRLIGEFEMTHDTVAEAIGRSRSTITNLLRLLELSPSVKEMMDNGELEMGHGRALLSLAHEQQFELARDIVKKGLSVRETEARVRKVQGRTANKKQAAKQNDPNIKNLENDLSERLGATVTIRHKNKGNGLLEIQYNSLDELDGILSKIK